MNYIDTTRLWLSMVRIMIHLTRELLSNFAAKRLAFPYACTVCGGSGELWQSPEIKKMAEGWEPIEPPKGEGWQLWETVSEGSPITPVFPTAEALVKYGDAWDHKWTQGQAEAMIAEGFTSSGMMAGGKFMRAKEAVEFSHREKTTE